MFQFWVLGAKYLYLFPGQEGELLVANATVSIAELRREKRCSRIEYRVLKFVTLYRPAMPFGNRKKIFLRIFSVQFRLNLKILSLWKP